jgi:integrase
MINATNAPSSINPTLAAIEGGLNSQLLPMSQKPKLIDQVRQAIRTRHYSDKTEKAYVHWIKRYIFFHDKRHPQEMAEAEIASFLSSLASDGHVSASTQNQAFNALLFLYKEVLDKKIGLIDGVVRAKRPLRLPVVLTKEEVKKVIDRMSGAPRLMAILLYGGGLRLMECCHLRVKDIDFSRNEIVVRAGKGDKDRHTMLPTAIKESLFRHIKRFDVNIRTISGKDWVALHCRTRSIASIRTPVKSGAGSGYSQRPTTSPIALLARNAGIIFMSLCYRER